MDQSPKGIQIYLSVVLMTRLEHLWAHILRTSAEGIGSIAESNLADSEVCKIKMSRRIYHNVFGLQVSVYDTSCVQVFKRLNDFSYIVANIALREA